MKGKTKEEKEHLSAVAELGCLICQMPAEVHHILEGRGGGKRDNHFDVIPLCPKHHRTGGWGVAIHAGKKTWQAKYGSERALLDEVNRRLK